MCGLPKIFKRYLRIVGCWSVRNVKIVADFQTVKGITIFKIFLPTQRLFFGFVALPRSKSVVESFPLVFASMYENWHAVSQVESALTTP